MPRYTVLNPIKTGPEIQRSGTVELSARQAASLITDGFLSEAIKETPAERKAREEAEAKAEAERIAREKAGN